MNEEISTKEAAALLGISVSGVSELLRRGKLRKFTRGYGKGKGGERVYLLRSQVMALKSVRIEVKPVKPVKK